MSTVERALKKLRDAQRREGAGAAPIAQVTGPEHDPAANGEARLDGATVPRRQIEFDLDALRDAGFYAKENQALADQYRVIKRPLLRIAAEAGEHAAEMANLVAVTSALASEGKTFTAVNLALSLTTEKDWRVLLIDSDCKNPQLTRLLGAEEETGLLDLLKNQGAHPDAVILPTSIPGLRVLPVGGLDEHAAELLGSSRMRRICTELSQAVPRQIVIFDTSPLLLTTESAIVCAHVGQVAVVVKSNQTPRHAVLGAIGKLDESKPIGLVLNYADEAGDPFNYRPYGDSAYATNATQGVYEI